MSLRDFDTRDSVSITDLSAHGGLGLDTSIKAACARVENVPAIDATAETVPAIGVERVEQEAAIGITSILS